MRKNTGITSRIFDTFRCLTIRFAAIGVVAMIALASSGKQTVLAAPPVKAPEIMFGFPEFPPLSFTNTLGEPDGYLLHLSTALFNRAGIPAQPAIYPARRLFENLSNGSIVFSMVVHNPVLDACCLYSTRPVLREYLRIYHFGGMRPVNSKSELIGKKIITIRGYSYAGLIDFIKDEKNNITREVAPTHTAAFAMLDAGRADYVLDYAGPASSGLAAYPVKDLHFEVIDHLDIYLVLSKSYPDAERVLARLTTMVKSMQCEDDFLPPKNYLAAPVQ